MITITNLSMYYGTKTLFEDVNIKFDVGKRYGLVGANGTGKTTLLHLLSGEESPSSGEVSTPQRARLGMLKQDHFRYEDTCVKDVVIQGKPALWAAIQEKKKLLSQGVNDQDSGLRLGELEEIIANEDGYAAESFISEILSGLGIDLAFHHGPMKALSGGFKLRVLLAKTLFQEPEILLLDEPTNHLDIISIRWLEQFLRNSYLGVLIFVSHDQDFLNRVSTHIVDIDYETAKLYHGNYDQFTQKKLETMELQRKVKAGQEKKIAELQGFVDRFRAKATKARQAQSRVKQIKKIEIQEIKHSSRVAPHLQFHQKRPTGKTVLEVRNLGKRYGNHTVLEGMTFTVQRGERIAVIGPNGIGKSTLLKIMLKQTSADHGQVEWGHETYPSYFAQDYHETLRDSSSVYEWLYQFAPHETIGMIRGLLGKVLFSGDDTQKSILSLSGGESARLLLAKMILEEGNVLVLDEPTNHLDLEGVGALAEGLIAFQGTVIVVSHDRHFVSSVATRILALTPEGARDFPGSYSEYLAQFETDYLDRNQSIVAARSSERLKSDKGSYEGRKQVKRLVAKLTKKSEKLEKLIESQETEIAAIEKTLGSVGFYQTTSAEAIEKLNQEKQKIQTNLQETMRNWEKTMEALEAANPEAER